MGLCGGKFITISHAINLSSQKMQQFVFCEEMIDDYVMVYANSYKG